MKIIAFKPQAHLVAKLVTPPAAGPRRQMLRAALPVIAANISVPLLGLGDTAIIGHSASSAELAALALATTLFNLLFWSFGFLRMGISGQVARAQGAGAPLAAAAAVWRALLLALAIGSILVAGGQWLVRPGLVLLGATDATAAPAAAYAWVRLWGAPATLAVYVCSGAMIGAGYTRALLVMQVGLNVLNLLLDVGLAYGLGLGLPGVALGTCLAEASAAGVGLVWLARVLPLRRALATATVWRSADWRGLLSANLQLWIRTVALLAGFALFTRSSAGFGHTLLAANHLLLGLISFSAFFLDGFAFVAESRVGWAVGARDPVALRAAVRHSSQLALGAGVLLALTLLGVGEWAIAGLSDLSAVRAAAAALLPWAAAYVLLSVAAFQLDGIYIGAGFTRAMRDSVVLALMVFGLLLWQLPLSWGVNGLWAAFCGFVVARALCAGFYWRQLIAVVVGAS